MGDRSVLLAADAKPHRGATRDRYQSPRAFLARDSRPEGCCMDLRSESRVDVAGETLSGGGSSECAV